MNIKQTSDYGIKYRLLKLERMVIFILHHSSAIVITYSCCRAACVLAISNASPNSSSPATSAATYH